GGVGGIAGAGGSQPILDCTGIDDGTECEATGLTNTICLSDQCVESVCGDGYTDTARNEFCDDGKNGNDTDGCTDQCEATCTKDADCDDGNQCNGKETCSAARICEAGTSVSCDDGNPCTDDACIPASGACSHQGRDDGLSCGSGKICLAESCKTSVCGDRYVDSAKGEECDDGKDGDNADGCKDDCKFTCKTNTDCNDQNACTTDTCNPTTHTCTNATITCANDGDACSSDACDVVAGCNYPLIDADGDGFSAATCKVGGKYATKGGDCDDTDARAFPGQTQYFSTARAKGGFDFNCDGSESQRYTQTRANGCGFFDVWNTYSSAPACGVSEYYGKTESFVNAQGNLDCKYTGTGNRAQQCR
ncbi:MAG: hypothetical protein KC492_41825, partial [Myxococcales bacterium]|nr:hypothetical protein [Myxococcales bacterium]